MQISTKFNAGDKVWIGQVQTKDGIHYMQLRGPMPILKVSVNAEEIYGKCKVDAHYKFVALHDVSFSEAHLFSKLEEAIAACQRQLDELANKQKAA